MMKKKNMKSFLSRLFTVAMLPAMLFVSSCSEDIDESNLYTFTGETIEDYLANRDSFSSFNYILERAGMTTLLSAYGTYTCFAPDNNAVATYIDSLYNDTENEDLPHNGMTENSLQGLTDSLCQDIALFHLVNTQIEGVDMTNGMTVTTMLGRDITTSISAKTGNIVVNAYSDITSMDNELENGTLHVINHVITRSNSLISGWLSQQENYKLFTEALTQTGLIDSLNVQRKTNFTIPKTTATFYIPKECKMGFDLFAETDEVLKANGIESIEDLAAYANKIYAHCADRDTGWYDYYRNLNTDDDPNNDVVISTGDDYENPTNCLNMFIRYHILKFKVPFDDIFHSYNEVSSVTLYEYYETLLPYTLMKFEKIGGNTMINPWYANNTLTDRVAQLASSDIHTVKFEGVKVTKDNRAQPINGYVYPIDKMLVYNSMVPHGVLNERMRFDDVSLMWETMSNNFRCATDAEIRALNGGVQGSDGKNLTGDYILFPSDFFENMRVYNDNTDLNYLPGQSNGWSNYQGDEFNCKGAYDFAFRLPPVPDGTYELRIGYTANGNRGMVQFYLGSSSSLNDMRALDIPLDMRHEPTSTTNADGTFLVDVVTGWYPYTSTDDNGLETDAAMRNLGYMRGPLYYTLGKGGSTIARANRQDLRRIITRRDFKQGEYWLRFKTVLPDNTNTQFHLDYIEFCPEKVYNSTTYAEDMF